MIEKIPGINEQMQALLEQYPEMSNELAALAASVETPEVLAGQDFEKIKQALESTEMADADMLDQLRQLGMDPEILDKLPPAV